MGSLVGYHGCPMGRIPKPPGPQGTLGPLGPQGLIGPQGLMATRGTQGSGSMAWMLGQRKVIQEKSPIGVRPVFADGGAWIIEIHYAPHTRRGLPLIQAGPAKENCFCF